MSNIRYKFRSDLDYKTLTFDGLHIMVEDVKDAIYNKERMQRAAFDLQITNAQTKRVYENQALIPRNSSVIVNRIPAADQKKLPKIQDTSNSGIISSGTRQADIPGGGSFPSSSVGMFGDQGDLARASMTEDEKIEHAMQQSTRAYDPSNYVLRNSVMSGPPPPTYVCRKCNKAGHWIRNCPMENARRATGIPKEELMQTTADDPQAYIHPVTGQYVVPKMHKEAFLIGKKERPPFLDDEESGGAQPIPPPVEQRRTVPPELLCPICNDLLKDAVLILCCGRSFCDGCVRDRLMESDQRKCPSCHDQSASPESLVPNENVRTAALNFQNETGYVHWRNARQGTVTQQLPTIRLGFGKSADGGQLPSVLTSLMGSMSNKTSHLHPVTATVSPMQKPVATAAPIMMMQQTHPVESTSSISSSSTVPTMPVTVFSAVSKNVERQDSVHQPSGFVGTNVGLPQYAPTNSPLSSQPPRLAVAPTVATAMPVTSFLAPQSSGGVDVIPATAVQPFQHTASPSAASQPVSAAQSTTCETSASAAVPPVVVSLAPTETAQTTVGPSGVGQPLPPGVSASSSAPFASSIPPPPGVRITTAKRDAWDDYLAQKDRRRRQKQKDDERARHHHSTAIPATTAASVATVTESIASKTKTTRKQKEGRSSSSRSQSRSRSRSASPSAKSLRRRRQRSRSYSRSESRSPSPSPPSRRRHHRRRDSRSPQTSGAPSTYHWLKAVADGKIGASGGSGNGPGTSGGNRGVGPGGEWFFYAGSQPSHRPMIATAFPPGTPRFPGPGGLHHHPPGLGADAAVNFPPYGHFAGPPPMMPGGAPPAILAGGVGGPAALHPQLFSVRSDTNRHYLGGNYNTSRGGRGSGGRRYDFSDLRDDDRHSFYESNERHRVEYSHSNIRRSSPTNERCTNRRQLSVRQSSTSPHHRQHNDKAIEPRSDSDEAPAKVPEKEQKRKRSATEVGPMVFPFKYDEKYSTKPKPFKVASTDNYSGSQKKAEIKFQGDARQLPCRKVSGSLEESNIAESVTAAVELVDNENLPTFFATETASHVHRSPAKTAKTKVKSPKKKKKHNSSVKPTMSKRGDSAKIVAGTDDSEKISKKKTLPDVAATSKYSKKLKRKDNSPSPESRFKEADSKMETPKKEKPPVHVKSSSAHKRHKKNKKRHCGLAVGDRRHSAKSALEKVRTSKSSSHKHKDDHRKNAASVASDEKIGTKVHRLLLTDNSPLPPSRSSPITVTEAGKRHARSPSDRNSPHERHQERHRRGTDGDSSPRRHRSDHQHHSSSESKRRRDDRGERGVDDQLTITQTSPSTVDRKTSSVSPPVDKTTTKKKHTKGATHSDALKEGDVTKPKKKKAKVVGVAGEKATEKPTKKIKGATKTKKTALKTVIPESNVNEPAAALDIDDKNLPTIFAKESIADVESSELYAASSPIVNQSTVHPASLSTKSPPTRTPLVHAVSRQPLYVIPTGGNAEALPQLKDGHDDKSVDRRKRRKTVAHNDDHPLKKQHVSEPHQKEKMTDDRSIRSSHIDSSFEVSKGNDVRNTPHSKAVVEEKLVNRRDSVGVTAVPVETVETTGKQPRGSEDIFAPLDKPPTDVVLPCVPPVDGPIIQAAATATTLEQVSFDSNKHSLSEKRKVIKADKGPSSSADEADSEEERHNRKASKKEKKRKKKKHYKHKDKDSKKAKKRSSADGDSITKVSPEPATVPKSKDKHGNEDTIRTQKKQMSSRDTRSRSTSPTYRRHHSDKLPHQQSKKGDQTAEKDVGRSDRHKGGSTYKTGENNDTKKESDKRSESTKTRAVGTHGVSKEGSDKKLSQTQNESERKSPKENNERRCEKISSQKKTKVGATPAPFSTSTADQTKSPVTTGATLKNVNPSLKESERESDRSRTKISKKSKTDKVDGPKGQDVTLSDAKLELVEQHSIGKRRSPSRERRRSGDDKRKRQRSKSAEKRTKDDQKKNGDKPSKNHGDKQKKEERVSSTAAHETKKEKKSKTSVDTMSKTQSDEPSKLYSDDKQRISIKERLGGRKDAGGEPDESLLSIPLPPPLGTHIAETDEDDAPASVTPRKRAPMPIIGKMPGYKAAKSHARKLDQPTGSAETRFTKGSVVVDAVRSKRRVSLETTADENGSSSKRRASHHREHESSISITVPSTDTKAQTRKIQLKFNKE